MPKVKKHFKVHLSLENHRKTAAVYSSNRLLALWVRLGMTAVGHFADRTGDTFIIPDRELVKLTGIGRPDVARTWLGRLADVSPISAERDGQVWRITFPNFARKQGFRSRNGPEIAPSPTPASSPTPTPVKYPPLTRGARAVWTDCQKTAAEHGKLWRSLTKGRLSLMTARLADLDDPDPRRLVDAIEGYVLLNGGRDGWRKYLVPETIYRPSKFTKYVEAYDQREHERKEAADLERPEPIETLEDSVEAARAWAGKPLGGDG